VRLGIVICSALLLTGCGGAAAGTAGAGLFGPARVGGGAGQGRVAYAARAAGKSGLLGAARAAPAGTAPRTGISGAARRAARVPAGGLAAGWWRDWPVLPSLGRGGHAPVVTMCAPAAAVRAAGHVLWLGDCAGLYIAPGPNVTVRVGQYVEVYLPEQVAANSQQLVPVAPLPRSSDPAVLRLVAVGPGGGAGAFRAVMPGRASLTVAPGECVQEQGACSVLEVVVASRGGHEATR
jgi:hypothetical protein